MCISTILSSVAVKPLHCLHNFLVLVGRFVEGCSCDVLLGLYTAVHAHGYSVEKTNASYEYSNSITVEQQKLAA